MVSRFAIGTIHGFNVAYGGLTANYEEWHHLDGNNQLKICVEGRNEEEEEEEEETKIC
jgi:hypothetical protein